MRIAIISDLHVGTASHAEDFSVGDDSTCVITSYIESFRKTFDSPQFSCDVLLVAGDITNRAKANEFKLASERIVDVARILEVEDEKIFFTPGNHDSNWPIGEMLEAQGEEDPKVLLEERYRFLTSDPFFQNILSNAKFGKFELSPYFVLWVTGELAVLSFNSSAQDSHKSKIHHGVVTSALTDQVKIELLKHKSLLKDKIKLILVHHHPINYEDKTFEDTDHSIMANASVLTDFAGEMGFDFIVHGHKHVARYNHMIGAASYPINILCAGSFSASLSNLYFGGVGNSFHIIEIDQRCLESGIPQGRILSWSHFVKNGWIKNTTEREELTHSESFGTNINRNTLRTIVHDLLRDFFIANELITWEELTSKDERLQYCSKTTMDIVLRELSQEIDFQIYRDTELAFYKKKRSL